MAEVIGTRTRGRRKELLRLTVASLVGSVAKAGKPIAVTVPLLDAEGEGKGALPAESVTFDVPKGTVVVPFALTSGKSDENAREQIRKGAEDAGVPVSISSVVVRLDRDGTEHALFLLSQKDA